MNKDTARGNTIKLEEFHRLPEGAISSGVISDTADGINIDNSGNLLVYVVYKYNNQDWAIFCMRYETVKKMYSEDMFSFVSNHGIKVQNETYIKRVFNCSKMVMDLYTH
jgi:hypothetical protein